MQIIKTGDEQFRMTISSAEARIFINSMSETIKQLGDWEFPARMFTDTRTIREVIASLEAVLKS